MFCYCIVFCLSLSVCLVATHVVNKDLYVYIYIYRRGNVYNLRVVCIRLASGGTKPAAGTRLGSVTVRTLNLRL